MKKLLPFIFTLVCLNAIAQRKETDPYSSKAISFGPELLIPGKSDYKYGVGASARAEYPVTDLISVGFNAGYDRLYYKTDYNETGKLGPLVVVPVKLSGVFFLDPDLYCDVAAGAAIGTNYDKRNTLALSFGVGYVVPIHNNTNRGIDVNVRFDDWGKDRVRQIALRVAYRLAW
jgi:hypothetical protein